MQSDTDPIDWRWSLLLAASGSLLVALPAALRATNDGASLLACWVALWGATALLVGPTAAALLRARPRLGGLATLLVGVLMAAGPMIVFARLLKRATHHRPLGAVTFALVAVVVILGAVAVAARLMSLARSAARARRVWRTVVIALTTCSLLCTAALTAGALGDASVRAGLLDGALAAALIIAAAWIRPVPALRRAPRLVSPAVWLLVVVTGWATLRAAPVVAERVQSAAPVLMALSGWLTHS